MKNKKMYICELEAAAQQEIEKEIRMKLDDEEMVKEALDEIR